MKSLWEMMLRWEPPGVWRVPWVVQGQAGESWLPAPSRESKQEELPFQVLCSCCLMFTGVLLSLTSILLLKRLELCLGCNLELCLHGQWSARCLSSEHIGTGLISTRQGGAGLLRWWQTRMGPTNPNCLHICPGENPAKTFVGWLIEFLCC